MIPPALLVDYGMVISTAQPEAVLERIAGLAGVSLPVMLERYWAHRRAYDRGWSSARYWSAVAGRELRDERLLGELSRLDIESWSALNPETLGLLEEVRRRGVSLALLSNAPFDLAAALDAHPALAHFRPRLFSARLGLMKPERAVFEAALDRMHRRPGEVLFVDDQPANVRGALEAGLHAVVFSTAARLRAELLGS